MDEIGIISFSRGRELFEIEAEKQGLKPSEIANTHLKYVNVQWIKIDGEYCKKGDAFCKIHYSFTNQYQVTSTLLADFDSILTKLISSESFERQDNEEFYKLTPYKEVDLNHPQITKDRFTQEQTIKWESLGGNLINDSNLKGFFFTKTNTGESILFTINNIKGSDYLILGHNPKELKIKAKDEFSILLKNDFQINFEFASDSFLSFQTPFEDYKKIHISQIALTKDELLSLCNNEISEWQLNLKSGRVITGLNVDDSRLHAYRSKSDLSDQILKMFVKYSSLTSELETYLPLNHKEPRSNPTENICYLYLMYDLSNGYYKIGISNKPEYREKTLQSEKPTIELIISKPYPNRELARSFEKALHANYSEKNLRGEWFCLNQQDVEDLKKVLA